MDRRDWVKWIGGTVALTAIPSFGGEWVQNPHIAELGACKPSRVQRDRKHFHNTYAVFRGVSGVIKKNVFLYRNLQKQIGEIEPHDQRMILGLGVHNIVQPGSVDCIGHAAGMGCDILAATNIHMLGKSEEWKAKASVEMLYAGSRIEIGQLGRSEENPDRHNKFKGRPGSHGRWVARFLKEYGVLHRIPYTDGTNSIDLTGYKSKRTKRYRDLGVPDWLESIAREHPIKEFTKVHTGREALDAVCAGQPVLLCSSYEFHNTRDANGFCSPKLNMGWVKCCEKHGIRWQRINQWHHCMILTGAILEGNRIGGVIQNSHGAWNSGPQPYDIPDGAFAVDLEHLDAIVKDWLECYAIASYHGHESKAIRRAIKLY